ncbi:MAG TPA: site-2 protease family protein [Terriglobales bacterium]|nr:site-2 protease family protein [Terriglobales bacterium]
MKTWSISIGSVGGVAVRVHASFLLLAIFVIAQALDPHGGGAARGVALTLIAFFAVLFHEFGHIAASLVRGVRPKAIMLLPVGGVHIRESSEFVSRRDAQSEIIIALAGPLASLGLALIVYAIAISFFPQPGLLTVQGNPLAASNLPKSAVWVNLLLAGVNLLPAYPLDGGRLLRVLLAWPTIAEPRFHFPEATRKAVAFSQVIAMLLMFAGISNTWFMLAGICLFLSVQIEDRSMLFNAVVESVRLEDIMLTEFATLSPADTLQDALHKAVHTLQDDFPVIRGSDLVGVINKQGIIAALRDNGNGYVQSAMAKVKDVCHRGESLGVAFRKITAQGATLIPVVDNDRLIGIVTLQNVMHSMGLIAESRRLRRANEPPTP